MSRRLLRQPVTSPSLQLPLEGTGNWGLEELGTSAAPRLAALRVSLDLLGALGAAGIAYALRFNFDFLALNDLARTAGRHHIVAAGIWALGFVLSALGQRLYDEDTLFQGGGELSRCTQACLQAVAILSAFVFLTHTLVVSRSWFAVTAVLTLILTYTIRMVTRKVIARRRARGLWRRDVILVAKDPSWGETLLEDVPEFRPIARLDAPDALRMLRDAAASRPQLSSVALVVHARDYDEEELWRLLLDAGTLGCSIFVHSDVRSVGRERLTIRDIHGHTIVKVSPPRLRGPQSVQKRILDIVGALLLLTILSPLLVLIALAILVSSGPPILFRQERMGQDGQLFTMLKFRSMRKNAEEGVGHVWAERDDPRRTRLGALLRRLSLDELPQLWNVLRGHMSLVGPRPEMSTIASRFSDEVLWYRYRHRIKPGLTGLSQAHGLRGNTSIESRIESDNWYIDNWSIWLDMKILFLTLFEVVKSQDAY